MILALLVLLSPSLSSAAGTFELKGKLRNFSTETIEVIDTVPQVYTIKRKLLGFQTQQDLKKAKSGADLILTVPFQAVMAVRAPATVK